MAEEVLQKLKREVEEECLKLLITEGRKEGKSNAITSCKCLEDRFQECRKNDGVVLATSVESGPHNEDRAAGSEGEGEKKRV